GSSRARNRVNAPQADHVRWIDQQPRTEREVARQLHLGQLSYQRNHRPQLFQTRLACRAGGQVLLHEGLLVWRELVVDESREQLVVNVVGLMRHGFLSCRRIEPAGSSPFSVSSKRSWPRARLSRLFTVPSSTDMASAASS